MDNNLSMNRMRVVSDGRETEAVKFEEDSTEVAGPETTIGTARSFSALLPAALYLAASAGGGITASLWLTR